MDEQRVESRVRAFFAEWGRSFDALCNSFPGMVADDLLLDQGSFAVTHTLDEALALFRRSREARGTDTIHVEVLNIAIRGNVLFNERIDDIKRADGSLILHCPVTGVMEFDDAGDTILRWREYFDTAPLLAQGRS